jgi:lysozyme
MPTLNAATIDLICEFEGFEPHWYPDVVYGWKLPTVAYGHTDAAGEPKYAATKSKTFSKAEGKTILASDLMPVCNTVASLVTVKLNDNQFGALVSFTYNLGAGNFKKSTLLKKVNAGDFAAAAKEFAKWNKAGKPLKELKGLTRRRAAEAALFLSPSGGSSPIPAPTPATDDKRPWWLSLLAAIGRLILDAIQRLRT